MIKILKRIFYLLTGKTADDDSSKKETVMARKKCKKCYKWVNGDCWICPNCDGNEFIFDE